MARHYALGALVALGLGYTFFGKEEKAAEFNADMDLQFVSDNSIDALAVKYTRKQLEAALVHSVSLDNKSAKEKLMKALSRQKFIEEYQTEGA